MWENGEGVLLLEYFLQMPVIITENVLAVDECCL